MTELKLNTLPKETDFYADETPTPFDKAMARIRTLEDELARVREERDAALVVAIDEGQKLIELRDEVALARRIVETARYSALGSELLKLVAEYDARFPSGNKDGGRDA
jgi:hypothetical protein